MSAESHRRVKEIYFAASELAPEDREAFLQEECGADESLRRRVEALLADDGDGGQDGPGDSLPLPDVTSTFSAYWAAGQHPSARSADPQPDGPANRPPTPRAAPLDGLVSKSSPVARYVLRGEIGRGGQGAILKVYDNDLRRNLAMKVILGQNAEGQGKGSIPPVEAAGLSRFLEEAQITGQLDHPGVVPVHELGVDGGGQVYFTMRLVKGRDLRRIIQSVHEADGQWNQTRVLGVLLKVCEAMAYAHDKQVVHRDLKPSNIMVGRYGEVYVMDWGLARVSGRKDTCDIRLRRSDVSLTVVETDRQAAMDGDSSSPLVTMDGAVVGTPYYMPPEQAAGRIDEVGSHSDVYAVGAMLYHLITGRMPYFTPGDRPSPHTVLAMVIQGPPTPVSQLAPKTTPELEAICEKAMARRPQDRYGNMGLFAEDLRAYLEGRVVLAHRTGAMVEFKKWVGRNKGTAASLVASMLLMIVGLASSSILYLEARGGQARARENEDRAVRQGYVASILAADVSLSSGRIPEAKQYLSECLPELRGWEWHHLWLRTDGSIETPALHPSTLTCVAFSRDGQSLVTGTDGGTVTLCDGRTGAVRQRIEGHAGVVLGVAFSAGGEQVLSVGDWKDGMLRRWDAGSGAPQGGFDLGAEPECVAFDLDGRRVAVARDDHVLEVLDRSAPGHRITLTGHGDRIHSLAFQRDGKRLLSGSADGSVRLWDLAGEEAVLVLDGLAGRVRSVAAHPRGLQIAAGLEDGTILRWEATGRELPALRGHRDLVYALAYSPDGTRLASASFDKSLRIWDPETGAPLATLWGHDDAVRCLAFGPGGQHLASGASDATLRLWAAGGHGEVTVWKGSQESIGGAAFAPDGEHLLIGSSWDATVDVVSVASGLPVVPFESGSEIDDGITAVAFSPTGDKLAAALEEGGAIWLWSHPAGRLVAEFQEHSEPVTSIAFTADGERLVSGSWDGTVRSWPAAGGPSTVLLRQPQARVDSVAISTQGLLASAWDDGIIRLWDLVAGEPRGELAPDTGSGEPSGAVHAVAFDPNGRRLASASGRNSIRIWDLEVGRTLVLPKCHDHLVSSLAFSPDGKRLVSGSHDHTVCVWDVHDDHETRQLLTLRGHTDIVTSVGFSANGRRIVSSSDDNTARIWSTRFDRQER